ncbi:MAG: FAD:protein FMN transferase, partial [Verrucomicrobiota bacterium]|nr:FAD:protein FMN transferase [Verrucomicrobiota bacterium]
IVVHVMEEQQGRDAIQSAFQRAQEINDICSDYNPESELMKLCRGPVNSPIPVSTTLATVLSHARSIAEETEGSFDPTLGGFSKLWRRSKRQKELPDPVLLERARQASGWTKFEVDLEKSTVIVKDENLLFDLGGIAKGYAADEMLQVLKARGITSAMVAVAGDVRLGSPPPRRAGWSVGIRTLGADIEQIIQVSNCAVSTSGDLERYVEIEGTRYSHIIDPETGLGLTRRIAATVVAPTAVQSDPLATFCCIRPRLARQIFAAGEISCRIVTLEDSSFDQRTRQFPALTLP